jgi:nucleoside-diphosphate-sugar epimerase
MIALITGAGGAAGRAVVDELLSAGYAVRTFSRHAPMSAEGVDVRLGDVRDPGAVRSAVAGASVVVHMAALLHVVHPDGPTRAAYDEVNVGGTQNVVEAAAACGVRRVVHISTIAVYGSGHLAPCSEHSPPAPDSPYAVSKLASEAVALAATGCHGNALSAVIRPAAIYGSRLKGNYLRLVQALAARRFVQLGDGSNRRSLLFDRDFARAVVIAASHPEAPGRIFNVSDGAAHRMRDVVGAICAALGRPAPRCRLPVPVAKIISTVADSAARVAGRTPTFRQDLFKYLEDVVIDSTAIRDRLQFAPAYPLNEAWALTVEGLRRAGTIG